MGRRRRLEPRIERSRRRQRKGEAWDASDESGARPGRLSATTGGASNPSNDPTTWNEFVFGLLDGGEFLIDDISVKNVTLGNVELIQNGTFSGGTAAFWRIIGTHTGTVVDDPLAPGNKVLKVIATGPTEHMHNHAGTTLKNGATFHTINRAHTYTSAFARSGCAARTVLHTRLYANRLAAPDAAQSSRDRRHARRGEQPLRRERRPDLRRAHAFARSSRRRVAATVRCASPTPTASASVELFTSINGAAFTSAAMTTNGDGVYSGTVPGQTAGTVVQFYVRATDALGAISFFPGAGPASRAMIPGRMARRSSSFRAARGRTMSASSCPPRMRPSSTSTRT